MKNGLRNLSVLPLLLVLSGLGSTTGADPSPRTYLVLPFEEEKTPDPARYWMREAMALSLGDYLIAAGQRVVDRGERLLTMEGLGLPNGAALSLATSIRLGHILQEANGTQPDRLIVGRISLVDGQIELSARVLDLTENQATPWRRHKGKLQDLLRVQEALARSLLKEEGLKAVDWELVSDDAEAGHDFPLLAYENYVRALITLDAEERHSLLLKATQQFPGYPKASFRLGELLFRQGNTSGAAVALGRIKGEPHPYSAEYHALLGQLALGKKRIEVAEAEAVKSMAARETPEGRILMALLERAKGNLEASRREMDRARELDPKHPDLEPLETDGEGERTMVEAEASSNLSGTSRR